jgi:hypothetical protein
MDDGVVTEPDEDNPPALYAVFLPNQVIGNWLACKDCRASTTRRRSWITGGSTMASWRDWHLAFTY